MKLSTHLPRNNTHVYTKSHNYGFNTYSKMPLFRLGEKKQTIEIVGVPVYSLMLSFE